MRVINMEFELENIYEFAMYTGYIWLTWIILAFAFFFSTRIERSF